MTSFTLRRNVDVAIVIITVVSNFEFAFIYLI